LLAAVHEGAGAASDRVLLQSGLCAFLPDRLDRTSMWSIGLSFRADVPRGCVAAGPLASLESEGIRSDDFT